MLQSIKYIMVIILISFTNAQVDIFWSEAFGDTAMHETGNWIQQTSDGGFIAIGLETLPCPPPIHSGCGQQNIIVLKTDSFGNEEFSNYYISAGFSVNPSLSETSDGGYIISGMLESGASIMKIDSDGVHQWTQNINTYSIGQPILPTHDEGFILTGATELLCDDISDVYLKKTDSYGNIEWSQFYFNSDEHSRGLFFDKTYDGDFIIAGENGSCDENNIFLIKADENYGNAIWTELYTEDMFDSYINALFKTSDNGFLIVGNAQTNESMYYSGLIIKTDEFGSEEWMHTFNNEVNYDFGAGTVIVPIDAEETTDGGIILSGFTLVDGGFGSIYLLESWLKKLNPNGTELWHFSFEGDDTENYQIHQISKISSTTYIILGTKWNDWNGWDGNKDIWLAKVGIEEELKAKRNKNINEKFVSLQNYPNPFNPTTILKYKLPEDSFVDVTVYDMLGNVVNNLVNTNQKSGYKSIKWNATNNQGEPVSAGVYLYKIQAGEFAYTKKMILLK